MPNYTDASAALNMERPPTRKEPAVAGKNLALIDDKQPKARKAPSTFNPPDNFSHTDIWGPKYKPRKVTVHAKRRRISTCPVVMCSNI